MTSKERAGYRAQAHTLTPVFQIGKGGITESVVRQTEADLNAKELIKIKVLLESSPITPKEAAEKLASETGADVIGVIGGVIILYRYSEELHKKKAEKEANKRAAAKNAAKNSYEGDKSRRRR